MKMLNSQTSKEKKKDGAETGFLATKALNVARTKGQGLPDVPSDRYIYIYIIYIYRLLKLYQKFCFYLTFFFS